MVSEILGAYFTGIAHFIVTTHVSGCLPTVYDIPIAQVNSRCVFTNTVPTGPYRGAGRPEASYLLERVIDVAADRTGIDAAELRRRNLIKPEKCRSPPRSATLTTAAISRPCSTVPSRSPTMMDFASARRRQKGRANCAASASAAISRFPARFRRKRRAFRFPAAKIGPSQCRCRRERTGAQDGVWPGGGAPVWEFRGLAVTLVSGDSASRRARLRRGRIALGHDDGRRNREDRDMQ